MNEFADYPSAGQDVFLSPSEVFELPVFSAAPPKILNPNLVSFEAKSAMEPVWAQEVFSARNLEVYHLTSGFIIDEGLVFDDNLRFVANCMDYKIDSEISSAVKKIESRLRSGEVLRYPGMAVVAKRRAPNNYGHFLLDMLPLAFIGRMLFGKQNPLYVLHRVSPRTEDVVLRSFRLLKFDLDRMLFVDYQNPVHFEEIVFMKGLTQHGSYMSPLSVQIVESMALLVPEGVHKRIFVRRVPGWQQGRTLSNEEELFNRLSACGYEEVEPGSMSLEQQMAVFRGADRIVGVSGAAMTNIVFCKPGTKVTLLVPGAFPDTFFWFIATHKRLDYLEIRGEQNTYEGAESWKKGFFVREEDIRYIEAQK